MRVGIIGWACKTGIGSMLRDMWDFGLADEWLAPPHPNLGWCIQLCPTEAVRCHRQNDHTRWRRFLDSIDVLVFIEHNEYLFGFDVVAEARRRGVFVCCVPMMEWLPNAEWVGQVDAMWAVTAWTAGQLAEIADRLAMLGKPCNWRERIWGGCWGVDLARFKFRLRERLNRFIFLNGHGGVLGRKGAEVIAAAARLAPEVPILFRTQTRDIPPLPKHVLVDRSDPHEKWGLYEAGDVLLAPSRWEGLGLQLYEAQACGLPVITTDGPPMNECHPIDVIRAKTTQVNLVRPMTAHDALPINLAIKMQMLHGTDISQYSRDARAWIEQNRNLQHVLEVFSEHLAGALEAAES